MSLVVPPYPPPRYTEAEPEVSARYHYLADQQATDGEYGLYPVEIAPKGGGPGPLFHRAMSEAFFLLSGTVKLSSMCRPAASTASVTRPTRRRRS